MESHDLLVRKIKNGTVIDHIDSGKGMDILNVLGFPKKGGNTVTISMNVPSQKLDGKDIVKIENLFLKNHDVDKIAVLSANATVNTIKNYTLTDKYTVKTPDKIVGMFKCPNPNCVTNGEQIVPKLITEHDMLKCYYCRRTVNTDDLILYEHR